MIDPPDPDDGLFTFPPPRVSGELAEWAFRSGFAGMHFSFDHKLRVRGHGQAVKLGLHYVERLASMAAGVVVLRHAEAYFITASQEQQWIVATGDQYRTGL